MFDVRGQALLLAVRTGEPPVPYLVFQSLS